MKKKILISLSYLLVAMLATVATLAAIGYPGYASGTKLEQLESLILERFIGDADQTAMEDAAAAAMVKSLGDRGPTKEQQIHPEFISVIWIPASFKKPPSMPTSPNSFSIRTIFSPVNASSIIFLIKVVFPAPKNPEIISIFVMIIHSFLFFQNLFYFTRFFIIMQVVTQPV